jgi:hypothetical protein
MRRKLRRPPFLNSLSLAHIAIRQLIFPIQTFPVVQNAFFPENAIIGRESEMLNQDPNSMQLAEDAELRRSLGFGFVPTCA